jgi:RNA polymerase sigma-70 factor (ECF subfamily)
VDDAELLSRWCEGDVLSGDVLLTRHYAAIYRFFRNKAPDAVDDLTQRTFSACTQGRARFGARASFRTYLFGIARNVLYEHFRHRRREERVDFGVSSAAALDPTASQRLAARQDQQALLMALRRLPLQLQLALELHYWEELTTEEISEVLELPQGTVKRRLQRGRQLLERWLAEGSNAERGNAERGNAERGNAERSGDGSTATLLDASLEDSR